MSSVETTKKVVSFIKQFVALVEGDTAKATAQKTFRQADSALKTHIAIVRGELIAKEDAVEAAEKYQADALVNFGKEITDRDSYVSTLIGAENKLTQAKDALSTHKEKIEFLEGKLEAITKLV